MLLQHIYICLIICQWLNVHCHMFLSFIIYVLRHRYYVKDELCQILDGQINP